MPIVRLALAILSISLAAPFAPAQQAAPSTFLARYQSRLAATQTEQPHWATPLITVNARLEEGFRADFLRQTAPNGQSTWNYGNAKGLQIVPFRRLELRFSPPPFFTHSSPRVEDGFGDVAFRAKYRIYGSSEQHHNAIITALLGATVPTGKSGNGSCCAILTPTLQLGKGFGKLALTTSGGGSLPISNTATLGRSIVWNNAIQYHATTLLWPQLEFNSTFYRGGKNDGHQQTFITPGLVVSRISLIHPRDSATSPLTLTFGAGEQIALTHFNTYNHSPIFTTRLRF
jgi:hypothetical protein